MLHEGYNPKQSQVSDKGKTGTKMSTISNSSPIAKVLFQTANAFLINEEHQRHKVKVVFDTCSDHSYITTAASNKVKFGMHKEILDIKGYNGKSEGFKTYNIRHAEIECIEQIIKTESHCKLCIIQEAMNSSAPVLIKVQRQH